MFCGLVRHFSETYLLQIYIIFVKYRKCGKEGVTMNKAKVILVLVGSVLVEIAQEIITYIADKDE